jgi:hypothetical protein
MKSAYKAMEVSAQDRSWQSKPQPTDVTFRGGEHIRLVPGHAKGHLAIYDPKHKALHGADAIHGCEYRGLDGATNNGPVANAVALHFALSTPNFLIQEDMLGDVPWRFEVVETRSTSGRRQNTRLNKRHYSR